MENVMLFTSLMYISETSWYAVAPVGVHVLKKTVGKLCEQAGFSGQFTNHSLRTAAATRLYDALDEQLIAEKMGIGHLLFGHTRELKLCS